MKENADHRWIREGLLGKVTFGHTHIPEVRELAARMSEKNLHIQGLWALCAACGNAERDEREGRNRV